MSAANTARISEIFSSIQGEGIYTGEKHLFIRFYECNLRCHYCDERGKMGRDMSLDEVLAEVMRLEQTEGPHTYVSLTGGEPLLYVPFLKNLLPKLRLVPLRIYLETNGVLWGSLNEVLGDCDVIAMDMKPSSVTRDCCYDEDHRRFLELAKTRDVFVKIAVSREIDFAEFDREIEMVANVAPQTPIILQPVLVAAWGDGDSLETDSIIKMLQMRARCRISDVRIMGRLHKTLNIR